MSPTYFLEEATMPEIEDAIRGQEYKERSGWEQTRLLISTQCDMEGKELRDIMEFPWEREPKEPLKEPTIEDLNRLKEEAKKIQTIIDREK